MTDTQAQELNVEDVDQVANEAPGQPDIAEPVEVETAEADDASEKSIDDLPLPDGDRDDKEKSEKLPKWAEKRLSKKEREIAQKAAEAEMYKAELEKLRNAPANQPQFDNHDIKPPQREDFETEDDYIDARIDFKNHKAAHELRMKGREESLLNAEKEFNNKIKVALDKGSEVYDDFEDRVHTLFRPEFPANRAMAEAIVDSQYQHDILYFLGTYPSEARKIALLNPVQAIKKIAEIENRFVAKRKANTTKASAPIVPLNSSQGKGGEGNPEKMNQDDFEGWYKRKYGR